MSGPSIAGEMSLSDFDMHIKYIIRALFSVWRHVPNLLSHCQGHRRIDFIYDRLWATLKSIGFNITLSDKPNLIVGERGTLRPTRNVSKFAHTIVVAFHSGDSDPHVSFSYIMSDFWDYTQGDQDFFNTEINSVVSSLNMNSSVIEVRSAKEVFSQAAHSYIGELRGLAKLRDDGVISVEEFELKKRRLMGI